MATGTYDTRSTFKVLSNIQRTYKDLNSYLDDHKSKLDPNYDAVVEMYRRNLIEALTHLIKRFGG